MFTFNVFGSNDDLIFAAYVRNLVARRRPLRHMCNINLHSFTLSHRFWLFQIEVHTNHLICNPNTFGKSLCSGAPNIRVLDAEYLSGSKFLNFVSLSIGKLRVRPTFGSTWLDFGNQALRTKQYPLVGVPGLSFLDYVLLWPKIQDLQLEATEIFPGLTLVDITDTSAPLSRLVLRLDILTMETLAMLIQESAQLRRFIYAEETLGGSDVYPSVDDVRNASVVISALRKHAATLSKLVIIRDEAFWEPENNVVETMVDFSALTHLQIDIVVLVGWQHCSHVVDQHDVPPFLPWNLGSLLPPSLEQLVLVSELDASVDVRDVLSTIAPSIAAEVKNGSLPALRTVYLQPSESTYCLECKKERPLQAISNSADETFMLTQDLEDAQRTITQLGVVLSISKKAVRHVELWDG